jgi:hypothetical protein
MKTQIKLQNKRTQCPEIKSDLRSHNKRLHPQHKKFEHVHIKIGS